MPAFSLTSNPSCDATGHQVEADQTPVTLAPGDTSLVRQRMHLQHPTLWSVDHPSLYTAYSTIGTPGDEIVTTFGSTDCRSTPVRASGSTANLSCSAAPAFTTTTGRTGAAAIDRAEERRIELLKAAGFNAIRAAHNPLSLALLGACDRLAWW
jgi:beta-galactosidase